MSDAPTILIVVVATNADRVAEGLRAGLGVGLRNDPVTVVVSGPARNIDRSDARIARALATLAHLGRPVRECTEQEWQALAETARAVEVWGDAQPAARRLTVHSASGTRALALDPLDNDQLLSQIEDAYGVWLR